jgi:hypothetical protein
MTSIYLALVCCSDTLDSARGAPRPSALIDDPDDLPVLSDIDRSSAWRVSGRYSVGIGALQLRENIQHRRGSVGVVMDHPPPRSFSSVDIGDPVPEGY